MAHRKKAISNQASGSNAKTQSTLQDIFSDIQSNSRKEARIELEIQYRRSIVTFIDILGFREIINSRAAHEIAEILDIFGEVADGDVNTDEHPAGLARSIKFSDSIVRVCPIDSENKLGSLFHELISLVHIQIELANVGVFLRGGLTVGDVYIGGGKIFGPAMNRAYDLESNFAIFPRIIIDPSTIETYFKEPAMQGGAHDIESDIKHIEDLIFEGDDQIFSVDYLRAMRTEMDCPDYYLTAVEEHKSRIITASNSIKTFNNAKQKYFWLANYHNKVLHNFFKSPEIDDLLVNVLELGML